VQERVLEQIKSNLSSNVTFLPRVLSSYFGLFVSMWPGSAIAAGNETYGLGFLMVKSIAALAGVLALFALTIWLIRRFQPGLKTTSKNTLAIEQRINLDNKNTIAVIRCGDQRWLIGVSPAGLARIDRLSPEHQKPTANERNTSDITEIHE